MSKKKIIWWLVGGVGFLIFFFIVGKSLGWIGGKEATRVTTTHPKERTIIETVTASGKIYPEKEVKISSDIGGEVVRLYVEEGDSVSKGDRLAQINAEEFKAQVDQLEASLKRSKAELANAKAQLTRAKSQLQKARSSFKRDSQLYQDGVISEDQFETSKFTYLSAKADKESARERVRSARYSVQSAEATRQEASEKLSKTNIYAPTGGIISRLEVDQGERVVGTSQFEGTNMMWISDMTAMEVRVDVSENDIVRVGYRDTALIEVEAYPNRTFKGVVTKVASSANNLTGSQQTSTTEVTNFTVKVRILRSSYEDLLEKRSSYPLRPGMSATADIQTRKVEDALSIPLQAVTTYEPESDTVEEEQQKVHEVVYLYEEGTATRQEVTTGIQNTKYIEIKEGLTTDHEVIDAPYSAIAKELEEGEPVQKVESKKMLWTSR